MKDVVVKGIFYGVVTLLIGAFLLLITIVQLTRTYPDSVIGFIKQFIPTETPPPFRVTGIAVIGDSQSDEYRADDDRGEGYESTTLNWVELLAKYRQVNFGAWGVREEPRRTGYEYDWARTGATTHSMIESGQHVGVAEQIKEGKVNTVIVFIGANDFAPYITTDGYDAIYNSTISDAEIYQKVSQVVGEITAALDTIQTAGNVHVLLIKIPDWGMHLGVQLGFPLPEGREKVTRVIQRANDDLEVLAQRRGIPTLDPNEFYDSLLRQSTSGKVQVGTVGLDRLLLNNDPKNMFLDDGIHMGTVMNGLFANEIITTLDSELGATISPFSTHEILNAAGINE